MLEVLFARAGQGTTFLRMAVCGMILGASMQIRTLLVRRWRRLTPLWDAATGAALLTAVFPVLLESGEGLRLYGLLGLILGLLLYLTGVWRMAETAARWVKNKRSQKQESSGGAGNNKQNPPEGEDKAKDH